MLGVSVAGPTDQFVKGVVIPRVWFWENLEWGFQVEMA